MQIDWITVAAQIINFLILVWLLKRFLYGPITRAMERRESEIQKRLDDARDERESAQEKQRELDDRIKELERERDEKLAAARREADDLRAELEEKARAAVDEKRDAWLAELDEDRREFVHGLRGNISRAFGSVAQSALAALADTDLSERLAGVFVKRLEALDDDDLARLAQGAREDGQITVESGAGLDSDTRRRLTRSLHEVVGQEVDVAYEDDVSDFFGLRVRARNATVEWSLDEYLDRYLEDLEVHFPARPQADADGGGEDRRGGEDQGGDHERTADSREAANEPASQGGHA